MSKSIISTVVLSIILLFLAGCNSTTTKTAIEKQPAPAAKTSLTQEKQAGKLSGRWISNDYAGVSGQLEIAIHESAGSDFTGELVFWQSSCPWKKPFSGNVSGSGNVKMTANLGGKCGEITIQGTYNGDTFIGTYNAEYPDTGNVHLR